MPSAYGSAGALARDARYQSGSRDYHARRQLIGRGAASDMPRTLSPGLGRAEDILTLSRAMMTRAFLKDSIRAAYISAIS